VKKVVIIGGSLGGLFAANLLHRAGWNVLVCERAGEALSGRGAGLVAHPALFAALAQAGVSVDSREPYEGSDLGVFVPDRRVFASDGSIIEEREYPQVLASWPRLYEVLRGALPAHCYRHAAQCVKVETSDASATVHFANGGNEQADLVIAADGLRSTIRAQLAPNARACFAGYIAWRGLVEAQHLSPATWAELGNTFGFCLPEGEQILGYPVRVSGGRAYNFVWYRPAVEATLQAMLTDAQGRTHAEGIAPPLIRDALITELNEASQRLLSPAFASVVKQTEQPFFQPINDLISERLVFGRTVLLGDAAFVARPHVGMGVTKAALDAVALAKALHDSPHDMAAALSTYEQHRLLEGRAVVERGRQLGAYMQAQLVSGPEQAHAHRFRSPQQVLAQTATPLW
jgi:2-polyprenyl-6-methoxyphenol hydroxylase-like FAD-dependent oxidoreductase